MGGQLFLFSEKVRYHLIAYDIYYFESDGFDFMSNIYKDFNEDEENFELIDPALMAFAVVVNENLNMALHHAGIKKNEEW